MLTELLKAVPRWGVVTNKHKASLTRSKVRDISQTYNPLPFMVLSPTILFTQGVTLVVDTFITLRTV